MLTLSRNGTFLRKGGSSFMIFTKYKEGIQAIRTIKYKKYMAGKYTRARAPLARKYTNRIFESKDGTTSMILVNQIERHNFCLNDLLTKSNRTEIRTYKVEERTFGAPCIYCFVLLVTSLSPCRKDQFTVNDEARRAKYISRIFKLLEHFSFYILHFVYVRRMW